MAISKVILNGTAIMDVTQDTVVANKLKAGETAHAADGNQIIGTLSDPIYQNKSVSPNETEQTVTADSGYSGLGTVTVGAISNTYIGTGVTRISNNSGITINGATVSVRGAAYYTGNVSKTIPLQAKTATPTASTQEITPDSTYSGLSKVTISAIPSDYIIPSGNKNINENDSNIDVRDYATVTVNVTLTEDSWIVKNSENLHDPSEDVQNTYINGAVETSYNGWTSTGFIPVEPDSYYLIQGTPGNNYNAFYTSTKTTAISSVVIPASPNAGTSFSLIKTDSNTHYIRMSGASSGVANYKIYKAANKTPFGNKAITMNGNGIDVSAYDTVSVNVPTGETINNQDKTVTPSESQQSISADSGYTGLGTVTVNAISSDYVGSGITTRSSADLTTSGATVSVPAGYYSAAASKAVASGSAKTPATTITANPDISINSSGLITATTSASKNITPTVSAGYVSSGTAGTVTVSGSDTLQLTTLGATTYNVSSSNQTITSGKYITGTQTIRAVTTSNISAANIKAGVIVKVGDSADDDRITAVTGTFTSDATASAADINSGATAYVNGNKITGTQVIQRFYTGSSTPASSLGNNGDIYLQE